jgi:hypothetical protein
MAYAYACFISYKRPPKRAAQPAIPGAKPPDKHLWLEFAEAFQVKLDKYLNTQVGSYRDEALRPGADYPRELATSLCKSMCMVALVVPEYFESKWCKTEWEAMETFEQARLGGGKHGLIIPVICTGEPELLKPKFGPRQAVDLRGIVSPAKQLSSIKSLEKIQSVANQINDLARNLAASDFDCDNFAREIKIGLDGVTPEIEEPSPFRR